MLSDTQIQPLVRLLSLAGILILLSQILEIWAVMNSGITGTPAERGLIVLSAVAGRIPLIVLADVVVFAGIIYHGNRRAVRLMGWAHLAMSLLLGLAFLALASKVLTLRSSTQGGAVTTTGIRAGVILALAALVSLLTALASLRGSRRHQRIGRKRDRTPLLTDTEDNHSPNLE